MSELKRKLNIYKRIGNIFYYRIRSKFIKKEKGYLLFDPSLDSKNMGDSIISYYCNLALKDLVDINSVFRVQTHKLPSQTILEEIPYYKTKIVCGTNLITPHFEKYSIWEMPYNLYGYNNIITLGVGWEYYDSNISRTSKFMYRNILSTTGLHSVRDSYTEKMFHKMGIHNVINTGCPSLWNLTEKKCSNIPVQKGKRVITTVTDYSRNQEKDSLMINILLQKYNKVYVWIQGSEDFSYLKSLIDMNKITVIGRSLEEYTKVLDEGNIDYIGTRLHAGIHAINRGIRSIIIAIDNRTIEMGNDVQLPYICRDELGERLLSFIEAEFETKLKIPFENIKKWKKQFGEE